MKGTHTQDLASDSGGGAAVENLNNLLLLNCSQRCLPLMRHSHCARTTTRDSSVLEGVAKEEELLIRSFHAAIPGRNGGWMLD